MNSSSSGQVHNLRAPLSNLVGRAGEIEAIQGSLQESRLVTLIGAGGVGKTRLALAIAERVVDSFRDGVWLIELAPVANGDLVAQTVATALNVPEQPGRHIVDSLLDVLYAREQLLVIDNCEHLVQSCAELVEDLLRKCSQVKVLATSRQALRLHGERIWRVPSLAVPAGELDLQREIPDAVQLFITRASSLASDFTLSAQNAAAIAQITRRLDGVPLAIELAAGRIRVLSPQQLVVRLDHRLRLLTGGARTSLPRQQTLRGTIEWSHGLLSGAEQALYRRLAVFAGGWTLEAAEYVCVGEPIPAVDILDLVSELVDKSLVIVEDSDGSSRFRMLETIREYAWEKLHESGEDEVVRDKHRDWCLALAEEAESHLYRAEQVRWLATLDGEYDNLRAGLAWSEMQAQAKTIQRDWQRRWAGSGTCGGTSLKGGVGSIDLPKVNSRVHWWRTAGWHTGRVNWPRLPHCSGGRSRSRGNPPSA
jgi:predicted ATPase